MSEQPPPTQLPLTRADASLALEYASARYASARDHLGNVRGQLAVEDANHFLGSVSSGNSVSASRDLARAHTAALRDQIHEAEAAVDIWRVHLEALTLQITHLLD